MNLLDNTFRKLRGVLDNGFGKVGEWLYWKEPQKQVSNQIPPLELAPFLENLKLPENELINFWVDNKRASMPNPIKILDALDSLCSQYKYPLAIRTTHTMDEGISKEHHNVAIILYEPMGQIDKSLMPGDPLHKMNIFYLRNTNRRIGPLGRLFYPHLRKS